MHRTNRRTFLQTSMAGALSTFFPLRGIAQNPGKFNVLFIAVDDLRPQLGCYGFPQMKTPHLDRLASNSLVFDRAYCQQAVCSPSQTSLLAGLRPDTTQVYDLQTHFRLTVPNAVTLPQYFKQNGYYTQALSKIYHSGLDDPVSWSVRHWQPKSPQYGDPSLLSQLNLALKDLISQNKGAAIEILQKDPLTGQPLKISSPRFRVRGPAWEAPDVADNALPDGETADQAVELLRSMKDQRFFLAVGFLKPHLPFVAPKNYFDRYPPESVQLADNPFPPKDVPAIAMHNFSELRNYEDIPAKGAVPDEKALELIRAYYAATSYMDAQVGRVLDELDHLNLREKTIVILWGDHGWQLGEHALWCKHTNFEVATRAPLILRVPGMTDSGLRSSGLVEFVDIYPTLCELCGLPVPGDLEGLSFAPLLSNPNRPWKSAAFSQYPRGGNVMGYSMRTDRYRFTEWMKKGEETPVGIELYDHIEDPEENENRAALPGNADLVKKLHCQRLEGWPAALPPGILAKQP